MSVKIRLARFGRHKLPFYHIVATDSRNRRDSKFLEKLGTFNPLLDDSNKEKIVLKKDRAEYWLSVGAIPTEKAAILMIKLGVKGAEKYKPVFTPKQKKAKEEPAVEANATAEAAPVETPVEEPKAEETQATVESAEEVKPAETVEPAEEPQSVEETKTAEEIQPVEEAKPAE